MLEVLVMVLLLLLVQLLLLLLHGAQLDPFNVCTNFRPTPNVNIWSLLRLWVCKLRLTLHPTSSVSLNHSC